MATHLDVSQPAETPPANEEGIESEFWNSPPAYSLPPVFSAPPPPPVARPSALRLAGAKILFGVLLSAVLALLVTASLVKFGVSSWTDLRALPDRLGLN
jgi:hypothetical protein